jgi:hypothetical protein
MGMYANCSQINKTSVITRLLLDVRSVFAAT